MILAITGALLIFGGALAFLFLIQRKAAAGRDPYDAGFAEAPDPVEEQYETAGDTFGWQRAKYFTDEEAVDLQATATPPSVDAGQDLAVSILVGEIYRAFNDYREGIEICTGAMPEPSPEVKR